MSLYIVEENGKYGLIGKKKKVIFPTILDKVIQDGDIFLVKKSLRWGIVSKNGELIIPIKYDEISYDINQFFFIVKLESFYGVSYFTYRI